MDKFCDKMREIEANIMEVLSNNKEIEMTKADKKDFDDATKCYLCCGEIKDEDPKGSKVRDHCHITGKYRGCAHNVCNINYNHKKILKFPCSFII